MNAMTASQVPEPSDDFDDLDALLADAVELAEARKVAKKKGTRTDPAVAAIVREADVQMSWEPQFAVARFVEQHCSCGASHRRFDSWYIVSQHRREETSRRFARSPDHADLPAWQYVAEEQVENCAECLQEVALPYATIDQLMGIEALGSPADCCCPDCAQDELELEEPEAEYLDDAEDKALWEELENA